MIPAGLRVFVALEPIDMRRSIDGLVLAVAERFQQDARSERALWVFANLRRDRLKVLWWDATGWCVLYKRLEGHRAVLPETPSGAVRATIDARTLAAILDGVKRSATAKEIVREARERASIIAPSLTPAR